MKFTLLFLALIIISSCQNDDLPNIPDNINIDLDMDGIDDFQINYNLVNINTPGGVLISCRFEVFGENEILFKEEEPFLFLINVDVIKENVNNPLVWSGNDGYIASYEKDSTLKWPENWNIASDDIRESYFIGIKLIKTGIDKVGWVEIEIDNKTGDIEIVEVKIL